MKSPEAKGLDLVEASRRPLLDLLRAPISDWSDLALVCDDGATEAVRWAGGLPFLLQELGISQVYDLTSLSAGQSQPPRPLKRLVYLITGFLWDVESSIVSAARSCGASEIVVCSALSEQAHSSHPQAGALSDDPSGCLPFAAFAEQLRTSLQRLLNIDKQGRGGATHSSQNSYGGAASSHASLDTGAGGAYGGAYGSRGGGGGSAADDGSGGGGGGRAFDSLAERLGGAAAAAGARAGGAAVHVSLIHVPLHMGAVSRGYFALCGAAVAWAFPLQLWQLEGGAGGRRGAAQLRAEMMPQHVRLGCRHLAHALAGLVRDQLSVDVTGHVFALGPTAQLIGNTLATLLSDADAQEALPGVIRHSHARPSPSQRPPRPEASLVLIDRTLDLATAVRPGGSLMARILAALPRAGGADGSDTSATAQAHLHDVTLRQPAYDLRPAAPTSTIQPHPPSTTPQHQPLPPRRRRRRLREERSPFPAVAAFPWKAPPSLCHHACDAANSGAAAAADDVAWALASLPEGGAHAALRGALLAALAEAGRAAPLPRKRGMGAEVYALLQALARARGGGAAAAEAAALSGRASCLDACNRHYRLVQVALAVVEALMRTARSKDPLAMPGWEEAAAAEHALQQALQDGATAADLLVHAAELLRNTTKAADALQRSTSQGDAPKPPTSSGDADLCMWALWVAAQAAALGASQVAPLGERHVAHLGEGMALAGGMAQLEQALASVAIAEGADPIEAQDTARRQAERLAEIPEVPKAILKTPDLASCAPCHYNFNSIAQQVSAQDGWGWGEGAEAAGGGAVVCSTLIGKLTALLLKGVDVAELGEARAVNMAAAGLGLLSAGISALTRGGLQQQRAHRARPADRRTVVIFVVGGFTMEELQEVRAVQEAAGAAGAQIILSGTTIATPDFICEQVFAGAGL